MLFCFWNWRQGHSLVGRVDFSFEENNWFHRQSFWELLILGQNMSEVLNWVRKVLDPDFELVVGTRMGGTVGWRMAPPKIAGPNSWNLGMLSYLERIFAMVIKLRLLRWGDCPWLSARALNSITCILLRGRQREIWGHRKKEEATCAGGRDWHDIAPRQGIPTAMRSWKRQGMYSPLDPLEGVQPPWILDF